ncbi:coagulation factor VII-like [Cheilinus undulatus]|uniref:coagulation factor VII-like n=1 Tax=Cheilinus undulatus TaxID=241271 RepID=UPI001BD6B20F|nr:coagulation factor VII-like [Cheilinus undulatus]
MFPQQQIKLISADNPLIDYVIVFSTVVLILFLLLSVHHVSVSKGRDPCLVNPCHNNGSCVYMGTSYQCFCPAGFGGKYCERAVEDLLKCVYQNGGCEHFCDGSGEHHKCLCASGYRLGADGRQCVAEVEFPCGRRAPQEADLNQDVRVQTRLVGTNHCPRGECPWQVLLQLNGNSHCGGVLINPDWVITAAHCIHGNNPQNFTVVAGEHNLDVEEGTEQRIPVSMAIAHDGYVHETADSDIALLRLSQPVTLNRHVVPICLPTKHLAQGELLATRYHDVSGWGSRINGGNEEDSANTAPVSPLLRKFTVPMIPTSRCSPSSAQFNFSSNLLCAGYMEIDHQSCRGDDGSPLVTLYGSTRFLTGVVAWGRGCTPKGIYGVYTNMANYVDWVEDVMKNPPSVVSANEKPAERVASLDLLEQKHV